MAKQGYSQVYPDETKPWSEAHPQTAQIPLRGGNRVRKALPPLALNRYEWERIGLMMGWLVDFNGHVVFLPEED